METRKRWKYPSDSSKENGHVKGSLVSGNRERVGSHRKNRACVCTEPVPAKEMGTDVKSRFGG